MVLPWPAAGAIHTVDDAGMLLTHQWPGLAELQGVPAEAQAAGACATVPTRLAIGCYQSWSEVAGLVPPPITAYYGVLAKVLVEGSRAWASTAQTRLAGATKVLVRGQRFVPPPHHAWP
ncbi:hypothetical protein CYMTET_51704 [Cymbomonas tetramitiformis]|uniref:Uncharacterized protein n=1 Tax=Cymbomonas tetramitiformis TaxID=36881 RepID=A0AAE0BLN3_9CHLO|nr:hypothetical protein CYMTET_51704 [Cymbomonas tetramitiformis]